TVYPDIEFQGVEQGPSQSVLLTICFSGRLPTQIVEQNIPIQISISFAEDFTSPVVEAASMDLCSSTREASHLDGDVSLWSSHILKLATYISDNIQIPFLPLRRFNHFDWTMWAVLSKNIEGWLIDEVDSETQLWTWGRDAFWLAFIAAYPLFPKGIWPKWNPRIPLEGVFVERWLEQSGD
ncbi:uncharacterized protein F5147DRAFT_541346, partial [Suillus discolor]